MIFIVLFAVAEVRAHAVEALCLLPAEANPSTAFIHICNRGIGPVSRVRLGVKGLISERSETPTFNEQRNKLQLLHSYRGAKQPLQLGAQEQRHISLLRLQVQPEGEQQVGIIHPAGRGEPRMR